MTIHAETIRSSSPVHGVRRVGLSVYAGVIALSAFAGAIGLVTGDLDMGAAVNGRLPLHSPVFGGIALAIIVGVPAIVLEVAAWRGRRDTDRIAIAVGVLLIGWIAVELAFIREVSFLQALFVGVGASLIVIGQRSARRLQAGSRRS